MQGSPNSKSKEIIEISYIGCEEIQEVTKILRWKKTNYLKQFSFNLRLLNLNLNEQGLDNKIFNKISELITLLKICLKPGKFFTHNQGMLDKTAGFVSGTLYIAQGKEEEKEKEQIRTLVWSIFTEIFGNKIDAHNFCTVVKEQKILEVLQKGITITLRANIKDIDLANFNKIKADLEEKLEQAENKEQSQIVLQAAQTEHTEQTQQETAQNKQVVPFIGSFSFRVAREISRKAPVVTAAIENNIPKYKIFLPLSNFLNDVIRLFFSRIPKLSTQKLLAITYHPEPQEVRQDEVTREKNSAPKKNETSSSEVKENQEEKKHITAEPTLMQRVERSLGIINDDDIRVKEIIKLAKNHAQVVIGLNEKKAKEKQKTLDEIFCETMTKYYDPQKKTIFYDQKKRILLVDTVFQTIFLKNTPEENKIY